jgi:hypothetical protein
VARGVQSADSTLAGAGPFGHHREATTSQQQRIQTVPADGTHETIDL